MAESLSGFLDGTAVEDGEGGFAFEEALDLGESLHLDWEEEGSVGYGGDVEAEAEARGFMAGELVHHKR